MGRLTITGPRGCRPGPQGGPDPQGPPPGSLGPRSDRPREATAGGTGSPPCRRTPDRADRQWQGRQGPGRRPELGERPPPGARASWDWWAGLLGTCTGRVSQRPP